MLEGTKCIVVLKICESDANVQQFCSNVKPPQSNKRYLDHFLSSGGTSLKDCSLSVVSQSETAVTHRVPT